MIVLIAGSTHTGKTALAQRLMERYKIPYLSIDHLKMGLIRSGQTTLTPNDDDELTLYLWPIVVEIIKTAIENEQNLIVEGCYIPFDWRNYFDDEYASEIRYYCLVMTENYIQNNFSDIVKFENVIERRKAACDVDKSKLIEDNNRNLRLCEKYNLDAVLIDKDYDVDIEL